MSKHNSGPMACVKDAFLDAGIDAKDIPAHGIDKAAMPAIAEHYGAQFHGEGSLELDPSERVIIAYETRPGIAHAEYFEHVRDADIPEGVAIHGVVTFRK